MREKIAYFATSSEAWDFMRRIDACGGIAGFPTLKPPYAVRYIEPKESKPAAPQSMGAS